MKSQARFLPSGPQATGDDVGSGTLPKGPPPKPISMVTLPPQQFFPSHSSLVRPIVTLPLTPKVKRIPYLIPIVLPKIFAVKSPEKGGIVGIHSLSHRLIDALPESSSSKVVVPPFCEQQTSFFVLLYSSVTSGSDLFEPKNSNNLFISEIF